MHRGGTTAKRFRGDEGMSLIGVVIAMLIIMVALIPAAGLLESTISVAASNRDRVMAANIVTARLEQLKSLSSSNFTGLLSYLGTTSSNVSEQGTSFTVKTDLSWSSDFISGGCASLFQNSVLAATESPQPVVKATVTVTWNNQRLATPETATEAFSPPSGAYNSADGNVLVSVVNAAGQPQADNVQVTLTGQGGAFVKQAVTDENGCVFFSNVSPSTTGTPSTYYTVTLNPASSGTTYVDTSNNPSPSKTLDIVAGTTQGAQIAYDQAATITVSDATAQNVAKLFGLSIENSILNSSSDPYDSQALGVGSAPNFGPVYPVTNGYSTWLGSCPIPPTTTGSTTSAAVSPGGTATVFPNTAPGYSTLELATASTTPPSTIYLWPYFTNSTGTSQPCTGASGTSTPVAVPVTWSNSAVTINGVLYTSVATVALPYGQFYLSSSSSAAPTGPNISTDAAPTTPGGPNATAVM